MPLADIDWEVEGVPVEVPPEVLPWKYMVPSLPLLAVIVVPPQKVPLPLTIVAAGAGLTVTLALLPELIGVAVHDEPWNFIEVIVIVLFPVRGSVLKLPVPPLKATFTELPVVIGLVVL